MTQAAGDPPRQPFREPPSRRRRGGQILRMSLAWIRLCAIDIQKWLNACCTELHTFATKPSMPKHAVPTASAHADNTRLAEYGSEPRQTQANCAPPVGFPPKGYFLGFVDRPCRRGSCAPTISPLSEPKIERAPSSSDMMWRPWAGRRCRGRLPSRSAKRALRRGSLLRAFVVRATAKQRLAYARGAVSPMNQSPPHCG